MSFSSASIASFAARCAIIRRDAFGQAITFRGVTLTACVEPVSIEYQLASGGNTLDGDWTVRILRTDITGAAPARGEAITYNGRAYIITQATADNSPAAAEYTLQISAGSAV